MFGRDPALYDRVRPRYPARVYEILTGRCGLRRGAAVFEIGPGTGIATRELLRRGADPLVLIEADRRLARFLRESLPVGTADVRIIARPFEEVRLPGNAFDLGVSAESFHWLPPLRSLRQVARALKPGGWWVAWSHHLGDPSRPSRFHVALQPIYWALQGGYPTRPPSRASERRVGARRLAELRSVGGFERISREEIRTVTTLSSAHVVALWSTFSGVASLSAPRRDWFLGELGHLVDEEFAGTVTIPTRTIVYSARRR